MGHVSSKEWVLRSTIKKYKQVMGILKPIHVCFVKKKKKRERERRRKKEL